MTCRVVKHATGMVCGEEIFTSLQTSEDMPVYESYEITEGQAGIEVDGRVVKVDVKVVKVDGRVVTGHPSVCCTKPGLRFSSGTCHTSFTPIPNVCGCAPSRRLNFAMTSSEQLPRAPSAKMVCRACSSIPLANCPDGVPSLATPMSLVAMPRTAPS